MTQDTALDMKDVELNELDQEKQPMAGDTQGGGGGEKNGVVKVKLEDGDDGIGVRQGQKFTGLSKEELLRVAGTPAWVRVRWALLILFWLGWLGMLAGAVVIIVQAPRCRPLPVMEWWNKGPLYQVGDPATFKEDGNGNIQNIEQQIEKLNTLKVKGLIIGPVHITQVDKPGDTKLTEIDPKYGNLDSFNSLIEAARKKSIQIILDLTPNYQSENSWFDKTVTESKHFQDDVKDAISVWLERGVGGIYFSNVQNLSDQTELLAEWRNIMANHSTGGKPRVLLASPSEQNSGLAMSISNETVGGQLYCRYLLPQNNTSGSLGERIKEHVKTAGVLGNSWMVGGHMASLVQDKLLRVYQILLFTLPGTPITLYGDEIGLKDLPGQPARSSRPYMQWDIVSELTADVNQNRTFKAQDTDKGSILNMYRRLSDLRGKERSLLHGDYFPLYNSTDSLAFLRRWDQNERYITMLNFNTHGEKEMTPKIDPSQKEEKSEVLPEQATVVLSSNSQRKEGESVSLKGLKLGAGEALLLKYPYSG